MERITRRRAVAASAVGVSAAWVAPSLLSVDAASAATLPPPPIFVNGAGDDGVPGLAPITVTFAPTDLLDGDLLIAIAGIRFDDSKNAGVDPPPGFTPIVPPVPPPPLTPGGVTSQTPPIAPSPEALRAYVWSRIWNTGDPTSYTFQKTIAGGMPTRWSAGVLIFRGSTGVGAAAGQGQVSTTVAAPSIVTGGANRLVVYIGVTSGPTTWTGPAGYTPVALGPTNNGNPQGNIASTVQVAAGPTGVVAATTVTPSDPPVDDSIGFLLELLP